MAVLVSDSFNRANNTSTLGTTDSYNGGTAKTWSIIQGGQNATAGISSNQAYFSNFGSVTNYLFAVVDAGTQNYQVQVQIPTLTSLSYLAFRVQDVNNFFIVRYYSGNYELYKRIAGTFTKLGSVAGGTSGDTIKVSSDSSGNITVYVNGVSKITATDTNLVTITNCGFGNYQSPTGYFDNFEIDDLATGASLSVSLSDAVSTTDSLVKSVSLYKNSADSLTATDSLTSTRNLHLSFSDTINSTDSLVSSKNLHISLSDTIGTTDSISSLIQQVINLAKTVTDTISLTDSIAVSKNKYLTLVDLFTLVDSIGIGGGVMSQVIQIRRGHEANLPVLNVGEPALTTDTQKMFIGTPNGNVEIPTLLVVSSVSSLPTPSVSNQFMLAGVKGGTGVADAMYMCKKLSNDTYDWVQFV